jgi:excinuclease ABC subunit B
MAKAPDKPPRDPAKHSKRDPAKPTRAKASRPDSAPLDPALAELLNPAIGQGRAGVGSQTGSPSPLVGEGREGAREVAKPAATRAEQPSSPAQNRPTPSPSPKGGGGRTECAARSCIKRKGML